jgi:hypothetical protein
MPNLSEDDLCYAFADKIKESPEFVVWLLARTKFAHYASNVRVLWEEQKANRFSRNAPWWRHWFTSKCFCTGCFGGRETDIFVVFESTETKARFALHIENKPSKAKFTDGQAEAYPVRARCWAGQERFLNYSDVETVLIAPLAFRDLNPDSRLFDSFIPYEDVAQILPCYAVS